MKKAAFLSFLTLCLGFTSCDNYEEPNPPAQSNPQETIFEVGGLSVEPRVGILDLDAINIQGVDVPVATVSLSDFPDGYQLQLDMELSADETFEKTEVMSTTITTDSTVTVTPDALQAVINNLITRDPAPLKVMARFMAYAVNGKTKVRLGDPDKFYCTETLNLVPLTPSVILEETYYFVYSKDGKTWDTTQDTIRMTREGEGSLYDNPKYTFTYDFTTEMIGDGLYWKIAPASVVLRNGSLSGVAFGPADATAQNGKLVVSSNGGVLTMEGVVMMTADMYDHTFEYIQAISNFYTPGNANGWSFPYPVLFTNDYVHYSGFVFLEGSFKFAPEPKWGRDFGQVNDTPDAMAFREEGGQFIGEGFANGGDNIPAGEPLGLKYLTLNYLTRAMKIVAIQSVGMIGGFNDWGGQQNMEPNEDFTEWTTEVTFDEETEWKIRMNDDWSINLGGDVQNLTEGGDNIKTSAGTYNVKLILKGQPYAVEVTAK